MVASLGSTVTDGCSGASAGLGEVATTPPESRASNSVPSTDAHLSVAFEDIFLSLPDTTRCLMVSGDLALTVERREWPEAEGILRSV
jgi:hypothetical protein